MLGLAVALLVEQRVQVVDRLPFRGGLRLRVGELLLRGFDVFRVSGLGRLQRVDLLLEFVHALLRVVDRRVIVLARLHVSDVLRQRGTILGGGQGLMGIDVPVIALHVQHVDRVQLALRVVGVSHACRDRIGSHEVQIVSGDRVHVRILLRDLICGHARRGLGSSLPLGLLHRVPAVERILVGLATVCWTVP